MNDELEEYQYKDHTDISFVYDESSKPGQSGQEEVKLDNAAKKRSAFLINICVTAVAILGLICVMLWSFFDKQAADETSASSEQAEDAASQDQAEYVDYWGQIEAYINASYQGPDIQYVTANGRYMSSQYLILELNKDELYPEAVALIWDDAGQHYEIITYLFEKDDAGNQIISEYEYALDRVQIEQGQIGTIIVNHNAKDGCVDMFLEKHANDGKIYSIFMRYQQNSWACLGELEGSIEQQNITAGDEAQPVYDVEGRYLVVRTFDEFLGGEAGQYWVAEDDGAIHSDYQISYNQIYWDLLNAPEWYMKRPVLVYGDTAPMLDETELYLLQGTKLKIVGVLIYDDASYYKVKTDTEKTGYILLKPIEKGTNCQVSLQSLPFDEVFSEKPLSDSDISGDAFTSFLPVISAPFQQTILPNEQYDGWTDLNGDGAYEKIHIESTWRPNKEGLTVKIRINDDIILHDTIYGYDIQDIQLFVLDLDSSDQWLEFGYCLNKASAVQAEFYRYDGKYVRSLGLSGTMCFGGKPEWESIVCNESEEKDRLTVRGRWGEQAFQYAILVENKTGCFQNERITECSLDTAVQCKTRDVTALYAEVDGEEAVMLDAGIPLKLISIYAYFSDDHAGEYYGYFQLEDGTYGYSEAFPDYYGLNNKFDLTALFEPMAG